MSRSKGIRLSQMDLVEEQCQGMKETEESSTYNSIVRNETMLQEDKFGTLFEAAVFLVWAEEACLEVVFLYGSKMLWYSTYWAISRESQLICSLKVSGKKKSPKKKWRLKEVKREIILHFQNSNPPSQITSECCHLDLFLKSSVSYA